MQPKHQLTTNIISILWISFIEIGRLSEKYFFLFWFLLFELLVLKHFRICCVCFSGRNWFQLNANKFERMKWLLIDLFFLDFLFSAINLCCSRPKFYRCFNLKVKIAEIFSIFYMTHALNWIFWSFVHCYYCYYYYYVYWMIERMYSMLILQMDVC